MSEGLRQDRTYRRGLVLGLTMAEIVILVIFCLLLALTATLALREERIRQLELAMSKADIASRLHDLLQRQFPSAESYDDYFKELVALQEKEALLDQVAEASGDTKTLVEDARLGAELREIAKERGAPSAEFYLKALVDLKGSPAGIAKKLAEAEAILAQGKNKDNDLPPILNLSEADGYFFETGSAALTPDFQAKLRTVVADTLVSTIKQYDMQIVEVVGHTDEQRMGGRGASTLDAQLVPAANGATPISALRPTDNAGLGMARAVAVLKVLKEDPRLAGVTILPLSGAQMIAPVDRLADGGASGDVRERRRIEIRVRRAASQAGAP